MSFMNQQKGERKYVAGQASNPGPLVLKSGMLPTVLCSPAFCMIHVCFVHNGPINVFLHFSFIFIYLFFFCTKVNCAEKGFESGKTIPDLKFLHFAYFKLYIFICQIERECIMLQS